MGYAFHLSQQFLVAHLLGGRLLSEKRQRPSRLENTLVDFGERTKALLARRRFQLLHGDELHFEALRPDLAILD